MKKIGVNNSRRCMTGVMAVLLALCLFIGTMLSFCLNVESLRADESNSEGNQKTVKIALFPMSGYSEKDENGKWTGIGIELMATVSKYTNWKVEYVECNSYEDAVELLDAHKVDFTGGVQLEPINQKIHLYGDICAGFIYNVLAVRDKNNEISYEDYEAMKGKKIAMSSVYLGKDVTADYLEAHGLTDEVEIIEYSTVKEAEHALYSGEVDMFATNILGLERDMKAVAHYGARPFFWMSYNGNEELVEEMDTGLMTLYREYPAAALELSAKYYDEFTYDPDTLTLEEKTYLDSIDSLNIGYLTDIFPYSYEENGEYKGIARTQIEALIDDGGLELYYKAYKTFDDAVAALDSGEVDVLAYYSDETSEHFDYNVRLAKRYAKSPYAIITKNSDAGKVFDSIAVTDITLARVYEYFDDSVNIVKYKSPHECMDAVADNKVDACVLDAYLFESIAGSDYKYRDLQLYSMIDVSKRIHVVVAQNAPEELVGIIQKLVDDASDTEIAQYVMNNVSKDGYYTGRIIFWGSIALIVIAALLVLVLKLRHDGKRIRDLTSRDTELGIWNTSYFLYHCDYHVHHSKANFAVVYMYLSQFRVYSNINGYEDSHRMLMTVLDTLQNKCLRYPQEHYGRAYGGRFVLLLEVLNNDHKTFEKRLDGIRRMLTDEMKKVDSSPMPICFGVCYVDERDRDVSKATARANMAVDSLRNSETGKTVIFDERFEKSMKDDYAKEKVLDEASVNDDFVVYYQSKVDIRTNQIVGAEALVRFADPTEDGKIKSPYFFIDYYERNGRICKLDFHVMNRVCKMLRRRLDTGLPVVPVSVNFSRLHFQDENFVSQLELIVDSYQIPRDLIEVEVTETALVEGFNEGHAIEIMDEMIDHGFRLSVDDFGTGYSSLGLLEQIPASVIKLDRSFFRNETDRGRKVAILRSFVRMSRELEVSVVCEGVEFDEDVELMQQINAYIAQGYRYSKPEPESDFEKRLSVQALSM